MPVRVAVGRRRPRPFLAILFTVALFAARLSTAHAATWTPIPDDAWTQQARPDSGGRDAIVLFEEGAAQDREGSYRFTVSRRLRIFTESGRDAGKVEIDYVKGRARLVEVAARSIRQGGVETELAPDQVLTTTILKSGGVEYSRATVIVPGIEPGCVVEYRYTLEGKYDGLWVWPWSFQNDYYTVESRFRWLVPDLAGPRPSWAYHRIAEPIVDRTCTPDCDHPRELRFVARCIPGAHDEAWAPPLRDAGASVTTFYTAPTMSSIDFWSFWKMALDRVAVEFGKRMGSFATVVDQARAKDPDSTAALRDVCLWLRSNVRSTAELSWGELQGDPKPRDPWGKLGSIEKMAQSGEGSPYEINLALAAAAQRLGFDACVCLLRDRREGTFDYDIIGALPTEPITAVRAKGSNKWRFYEPASRFALPENVPWYLRGGHGLVAGPGSFLTINVAPEDGVAADARWNLDLTLDSAGGLSGRWGGAIRGEQARSYRAWLWAEDPARHADLLKDDLSPKGMPALEVDPVDLAGSPDSAFVIGGTARYPLLAAVTGAVTTLPIEKLAPWRIEGDFTGDRRTQPIYFRYPRHEVVTIDLHLPARATVDDLPRAGEFRNSLGSWTTRWSRIADGVRFERTVDLEVGQVDASSYPRVRTFFDGLAEADRTLLLVNTP